MPAAWKVGSMLIFENLLVKRVFFFFFQECIRHFETSLDSRPSQVPFWSTRTF